MAFVSAPGAVLGRHSNFTGNNGLVTQRAARSSSVRMAGLTDKERKSFAKVGGTSKWRENLFTGGFPGGEEAFRKWAESGMDTEVPDLPDFLQPTTSFKKSVDSRATPTVLERVTSTEFFQKVVCTKTEEPATSDAAISDFADSTEAEEPPVVEEAAPAEALYSKFYPAEVRNLAPMISITYEKDFVKDRVGVAMSEVTASPTDVYFPKEMSGKAPFIDISYDGKNAATASISVRMADVDPLPTIAPPVAAGETFTKLVPGNSGGLKLEFEVQGEGPVNVYSDPRCIDNFNKMVSN